MEGGQQEVGLSQENRSTELTSTMDGGDDATGGQSTSEAAVTASSTAEGGEAPPTTLTTSPITDDGTGRKVDDATAVETTEETNNAAAYDAAVVMASSSSVAKNNAVVDEEVQNRDDESKNTTTSETTSNERKGGEDWGYEKLLRAAEEQDKIPVEGGGGDNNYGNNKGAANDTTTNEPAVDINNEEKSGNVEKNSTSGGDNTPIMNSSSTTTDGGGNDNPVVEGSRIDQEEEDQMEVDEVDGGETSNSGAGANHKKEETAEEITTAQKDEQAAAVGTTEAAGEEGDAMKKQNDEQQQQEDQDVIMEDGEVQEQKDGDDTKQQQQQEENEVVDGGADEETTPQEEGEEEGEEEEEGKISYSTRTRTSQAMNNKGEGADSEMGDTSSVTGKGDNASDVDAGQEVNSDYGGGDRGGSSSQRPPADDALVDKMRETKETKERTIPSTSFLDESLTEEERRTRTRYLPGVEGIRKLYKSEIKKDVALARSIVDSSGVSTTLSKAKKSKSKKIRTLQQQDDDRMDVIDEGDETGQSEDDRVSDVSSRMSSGAAAAGKMDSDDNLLFPSCAFVVPSSSSGGNNASTTTSNVVDTTPLVVVESITAFDPPRPPESMGAKKKHRLMRWERRPQEVELDLNKYRQTVQKTREELHSAIHELDRIESTKAILRTHYLNHLHDLSTETNILGDELSTIQKECIKASDMLTSKTRSKGMSKGGQAMKDVISILKNKGSSIKARQISLTTNNKSLSSPAEQQASSSIGIGGVSAVGFDDWVRSTNINPSPIADSWILPGDKVQTPVGDGVVIHVYGPSVANVEEVPLEDVRPKPAPASSSNKEKAAVAAASTNTDDAMKVEEDKSDKPTTESGETASDAAIAKEGDRRGSKEGVAAAEAGEVKSSDAAAKDKENDVTSKNVDASVQPTAAPSSMDTTSSKEKQKSQFGGILAPRICVRLPFGVGFFSLCSVESNEDPSSYSDAMLASRWQKMVDTASLVGCCLDVAGMEHKTQQQDDELSASDHRSSSGGENESDDPMVEDNSNRMDIDEKDQMKPVNSDDHKEVNDAETAVSGKKKAARRRVFPFGAGLLPTATCRGALLSSLPIPVLEAEMKPFLFDGEGVLGTVDNVGVPTDASKWEEQRYELLQLRAKVLQSRNELRRQRRIRTLNERTCNMYRDRSRRVENLVSEMKTDLKNLKNRLEDEVVELGFDEEKAANLLAGHFLDQDDSESSTIDATPPPKRKRHSTTDEGGDSTAIYNERSGHQEDDENVYSTDTGLENEVNDEMDSGAQRVKRARLADQ